MELAGKKVLVVHPFAEDIASQYKTHRKEIWQDPNVLPEFELITYKSGLSILGIKTPYKTWFDALEKMENDISKIDFDIALIIGQDPSFGLLGMETERHRCHLPTWIGQEDAGLLIHS